MTKLGYFIFLSVLFPQIVFAGVVISEIMYDVEGTDSGREWIEIFNDSNEDLDLSGWKLYENETNHKINLVEEAGSLIISANSYAVIVDNPDKFLIDWPSFSGLVLDSAFSLKNTGEELTIRNADLSDMDSVFYDVEVGGSGDGNSLQKINGLWEARLPTPGVQNAGFEEPEEELGQQDESSSMGVPETYIPPEQRPKITAHAGKDKTMIAGATGAFIGEAFGLNNEPLENPRYLWNFGDGTLKDGKNVGHFYKYIGEYKVILDVSSGGFSSVDSLVVKVVPNEIFISEIKTGIDSFLELENRSRNETNISGWQIKYNNQKFTFSKNSFIRPFGFLVIPISSSGIFLQDVGGLVNLLYPNGVSADSFSYQGVLLEKQSFSRAEEGSILTKETPGIKNETIFVYSKKEEQIKTTPILSEPKIEEINQDDLQEDLGEVGKENQANVIAIAEDGSGLSKKFYYFGIFSLVLFAGAGVFYIRRDSNI
ncbi:lamin tail domain-containing protein [Patescibacteria group bacterium]